jgi:CBS domain-containing protein
MNVAAILKGKGRDVVTTGPETSLLEVARKLAEKRIGAIVVMGPGGEIGGIVSERDIIRSIAQRGPACLQEPVSRSMTHKVETCDVADTLDELMASMTAGRFRHLPVVDRGKLAGIVSIGDVVKHHIAEVEMEASALKDYIATG